MFHISRIKILSKTKKFRSLFCTRQFPPIVWKKLMYRGILEDLSVHCDQLSSNTRLILVSRFVSEHASWFSENITKRTSTWNARKTRRQSRGNSRCVILFFFCRGKSRCNYKMGDKGFQALRGNHEYSLHYIKSVEFKVRHFFHSFHRWDETSMGAWNFFLERSANDSS